MTPIRSTDRPAPPAAARLVLWLALDRVAHESIAGDLEEEFAVIARGPIGPRRARRWFWRHVLTSISARWSHRSPVAARTPAPRGASTMPVAFQDVRFGARQLARNPGFALAAVATLALGIAATTTIFGLVNALVLRPLPYRDASRVTFLLGWNTAREQMAFNVRYADAMDLAAATDAFAGVATYRPWSVNLSGDGLPERALAYRVTANTFRLLGVEAAIGRTFTDGEDVPGRARVAVLGHGLWARRFGSDPSVVGRTIALNGEPYEVVGVMPRGFDFPIFNFKGDLWTPLPVEAAWTAPARTSSPSVVAVGRLADGASVASAQAAADTIMGRIAAEHPDTNRDRGVHVVPMGQLGTEQAAPAFVLMSIAVVFVLLIACANVANLLVARSLARARELAVRAALGAARWRLVRQLLVESTLLALGGGALGVLLAWWGLEAMRRALPEFVARVLPGVDAIRVDSTALAFTVGLSLATVLVFGLLPAVQAVSPRLADVLKSGARGATTGRRRLRGALVIAEVTVSVALLVTTGLVGRSVGNLLSLHPGFDKDRVLAFSTALPPGRYDTPEARQAFVRDVVTRVDALAGVEAVGTVNSLPFSTSNETAPFRFGGAAPDGNRLPSADYRIVSGDYFTAMGIPILQGRALDDRDGLTGQPVAVVNRTFVARYGGDGDVVGRRLVIGDDPARATAVTIVGVVGDVLHWVLTDAPAPEIYVPYGLDPRTMVSFAVRAAGDPSALAGAVRSAVAAADPDQAVYDVAPMTSMVANSLVAQTLASSVMRVFGLVALMLSSLGLYGVLAYLIGQRRQEIGVRVALGATRADVVGMVLRQSFHLVGLGLVLGLLLAAGATRSLASLLYGVGPLDPATYLGTAAVILLVGLAATVVPARRALAVDPVVALRME